MMTLSVIRLLNDRVGIKLFFILPISIRTVFFEIEVYNVHFSLLVRR